MGNQALILVGHVKNKIVFPSKTNGAKEGCKRLYANTGVCLKEK